MDPPLTFVGLLSSRTRITSFARNFLSHKKEDVAFFTTSSFSYDNAVTFLRFLIFYNKPTRSRLGFNVSAPGCHFAGQTSSPCSATN